MSQLFLCRFTIERMFRIYNSTKEKLNRPYSGFFALCSLTVRRAGEDSKKTGAERAENKKILNRIGKNKKISKSS